MVLDMETSQEAGVVALSLSSYYLVNDGLQHEVKLCHFFSLFFAHAGEKLKS